MSSTNVSAPSRVSLRRYKRSDEPNLGALLMDAEVMRYVEDGRPLAAAAVTGLVTKILAIYRDDPTFFIWAVQENDECAGHAELKRRRGRTEYELIYFLERARWGRGLGGRVVDLIVKEAEAREIPFVIATVDGRNVASIAILKRRAFVRDDDLSAELACEAFHRSL